MSDEVDPSTTADQTTLPDETGGQDAPATDESPSDTTTQDAPPDPAPESQEAPPQGEPATATNPSLDLSDVKQALETVETGGVHKELSNLEAQGEETAVKDVEQNVQDLGANQSSSSSAPEASEGTRHHSNQLTH